MAVDSNAMTLAEYGVISNEPRVTAVTNSLLDNGSIMARDVPFITRPSLYVNFLRVDGNLPTVGWVKINEEGAVTKGQGTPGQAQAFIIRNKIQVDKFIRADENQIVDPVGFQVDLFAKAVAYDWNDKFINNAHDTGDADALVGLRTRLDNTTTYGLASGNKINASATMTTAATAANVNAFLEKLDELLWAVGSPSGDGVVIYMNEVMQRRLHFALRLLGANGGLDQTRDQFDRTVPMYKGARIEDPGYKADQATRIITVTEANTGAAGASTYTSVYAVNYGANYTRGWQFAPLSVSPPMMTEGGAVLQTTIDWAGGLVMQHNRSCGRLYGVNLG
jgi:hypothetical protein